MEHNGTEKVEYGMRAAVESVGLQRACLRVVPPGPYEGAPGGGRGEVMSKETRKCRADYHAGCSPRKRVKCANQPGRRFSDRERPVCRSVAEEGHPLALRHAGLKALGEGLWPLSRRTRKVAVYHGPVHVPLGEVVEGAWTEQVCPACKGLSECGEDLAIIPSTLRQARGISEYPPKGAPHIKGTGSCRFLPPQRAQQ